MSQSVKSVDRSPKFSLSSAQKELDLPLGTPVMGDRVGGLSTFANSFKRGSGDRVFGSDENGIWLGAADFENAPFRVRMDGSIEIRDVVNPDDSSYFNAKVFIFYNDGVPEIVIGDPTAAP